LSYIQGGSADIWKENIMENLEIGNSVYTTIKEFLTDLKQTFKREDNEIMKVVELKKVKQESKMMKEFV